MSNLLSSELMDCLYTAERMVREAYKATQKSSPKSYGIYLQTKGQKEKEEDSITESIEAAEYCASLIYYVNNFIRKGREEEE